MHGALPSTTSRVCPDFFLKNESHPFHLEEQEAGVHPWSSMREAWVNLRATTELLRVLLAAG